MTDSTDDLPDDIEPLKALVRSERSEKARLLVVGASLLGRFQSKRFVEAIIDPATELSISRCRSKAL